VVGGSNPSGRASFFSHNHKLSSLRGPDGIKRLLRVRGNMRTLIVTAMIFASGTAFSMPETMRITTPRGAEIDVIVHAAASHASPTIIVAPGQSCNSKGPLFETIGLKGPTAGFTVVRFEWAYCLKDPTKPVPSADLKNEIEDYMAVLEHTKSLTSVDPNKIVIAGKSLGSIVAYSVFRSTASAKALALLTPVCSYTTDEKGNPLPEPQSVCDEYYPEMKKDTRPVMMAVGEKDDLCILNVLFDYLKNSKGNIQVSVAGGDHGFRLKKSDGSIDEARTNRNMDTVVNGFFNWADLKINP